MMPYFALDNREISYWFPFVKPAPWYKSIWRVSVYGPFIYFFRWMFSGSVRENKVNSISFEEYKELTLYIVYMHKCFHWMSLIHNPSGSMLTKLNNIIVDNSEEVFFFFQNLLKLHLLVFLKALCYVNNSTDHFALFSFGFMSLISIIIKIHVGPSYATKFLKH